MIQWIKHAIRGGAVKRFHTVPTIKEETVGEHSFGVAMMVLAITNHKASAELLRAALFHDMAEQTTGDSPYTAKRAFPMLKCLLESVEESWEKDNGFHIDLNERDRNLLKAADMMQLLWRCKLERDLGNTNMDRVFNNGVYFLENHPLEGNAPAILEWLVSNYKGEIHGLGRRSQEQAG